MQGLHLTAELHDCAPRADDAPDLMRDADALRALCRHVVVDAGLTAIGELFHAFAPPGGVTGMVLLAESHVAVHTWPEQRAVTLDVYVCNYRADNSGAARAVMDALAAAFAPSSRTLRELARGA